VTPLGTLSLVRENPNSSNRFTQNRIHSKKEGIIFNKKKGYIHLRVHEYEKENIKKFGIK